MEGLEGSRCRPGRGWDSASVVGISGVACGATADRISVACSSRFLMESKKYMTPRTPRATTAIHMRTDRPQARSSFIPKPCRMAKKTAPITIDPEYGQSAQSNEYQPSVAVLESIHVGCRLVAVPDSRYHKQHIESSTDERVDVIAAAFGSRLGHSPCNRVLSSSIEGSLQTALLKPLA